jgi:hypothetical protein
VMRIMLLLLLVSCTQGTTKPGRTTVFPATYMTCDRIENVKFSTRLCGCDVQLAQLKHFVAVDCAEGLCWESNARVTGCE